MTFKKQTIQLSLLALAGLLFFAPTAQAQSTPATKPTVAEALAFIDGAEKELNTLQIDSSRAGWVEETFITDDTVKLLAEAGDRLVARQTELIGEAKRFDGLALPAGCGSQIACCLSSAFAWLRRRTQSCAPRPCRRPRNWTPLTGAAGIVRMPIRNTAWASTKSASRWRTAAIPRNWRRCGRAGTR